MSRSEKNKQIAKNTLFLYIRMFLIMGVTLYTSRIILQTLGLEDFGIYNVVAAIVIFFSFINNAMSIASQRFLSFALGKHEEKAVQRVFSMSLTFHLVIACLVFLAAETIGLWMLWKMNFPVERLDAIGYTYQFVVFTCIVQIIRVPYNATIIAYERMSFYAWISIIEVFLQLAIVFLLSAYDGDRLIFYSFLLLVVKLLINVAYTLFCNRTFTTTHYHYFWDAKLFKEFVSFSSWSLAGSLANVSATQGLNMIINIFCGVTVNAAVGIANQVMSAVSQFLASFQTAFNPQLVKTYAMEDKEYFMNLIFKTSKFSYYLMFLISLPALVNCRYLLHIWLGTVPEYATEFSALMIIFLLFDAVSGPLWISVQATGKIKNYQLLMSLMILMNLPVAYLVLYLGYSPIYVFVGRVVINALTFIVRIFYIRPLVHLPARQYFVHVVGPVCLVTLVSLPLPLWMGSTMASNMPNMILQTIVCICITGVCTYVLGLNRTEKAMLTKLFMSKIVKK